MKAHTSRTISFRVDKDVEELINEAAKGGSFKNQSRRMNHILRVHLRGFTTPKVQKLQELMEIQ